MNVAAWVIFGTTCFAAFVIGIAYFCDDIDDELLKKISKPMIIVSAICLVLGILLPTKQDAYIIFGIGSVVDYIQENDEAKQLPDKTVKMLNALADKYTEETEKKHY
jgi:hypothetical protein